MPAVCCEGKVREPLSEGCSIDFVPEDDGCQHTRKLVRIALPEVPGVYAPFVHHDCLHNQLVAINNRVCGVVPLPTPSGVALIAKAARRLGMMLPQTVEEDYYVMPTRYSGRKATRYLDATNSIMQHGFDLKRHSVVKAFVKAERTDGISKPNPDPRMIQFRDPKYCVELTRFLKPIEEHLYRIKGISRGVPMTRNVAKGLNQVERASLLREKLSNFTDPVVIGLDASRFDKHVNSDLLNGEFMVYLCSNPSREFATLLKAQLRNKCFSTKGIKYKTKAKRMSGDMNTALGNCIIMLIMLLAFMDWCSVWDTLDDGDDVLVIIEAKDLPQFLRDVKKAFLEFGMNVKVESVAYSLHEVEFCQSKVIHAAGGFKFVRNPIKVLSCALSGVRYFGDVAGRRNLLYSIGTCELVLNLGVPVLQAFALAIRRNATRGKFNANLLGDTVARLSRELKTYRMHINTIVPIPITDLARDSFAVAFGMDCAEQIRLEKAFDVWEFNIEGGLQMPEEWTSEWVNTATDSPEWYPLYG